MRALTRPDALKALEASSGPIVHGSVVVTKDLSGNLFLHETTKEKIGGMTAGAFFGGLAGLSLGAAATILRAAAGALIGATADFINRRGAAKLANNIGRELEPGETTLIIDITHNKIADLEAKMKSAGGTIIRQPISARDPCDPYDAER